MGSTRAMIAMLAVVLVVVVAEGAKSLAPAPAPAPDCSLVLVTMADCLTYVQNGSTEAKPNARCCAGLKSVLQQSPLCLCDVLKNSANLGIPLNLNTTRALGLPSACNLAAPSVSACSGGGAPTPAPQASKSSPSPKASSPMATPSAFPPATPPTNGGGSISTSLAPSPGHSGGNVVAVSSLMLCVVLGFALVSYH